MPAAFRAAEVIPAVQVSKADLSHAVTKLKLEMNQPVTFTRASDLVVTLHCRPEWWPAAVVAQRCERLGRRAAWGVGWVGRPLFSSRPCAATSSCPHPSQRWPSV